MANSTVGTIFYYIDSSATPKTYQIYGLMTKPALPGLPNSIDATSQEDRISKNTAGVIQLPDANFQFKHEKFDETTTNFEKFKELEADTKVHRYGIKYPDGGAVEWDAKPYVQRDGNGGNALDTFTVAFFEMANIDDDAVAPEDIVMVEGV